MTQVRRTANTHTHTHTGSGLTASTRKNVYMLTWRLTLDTHFNGDVDVLAHMLYQNSNDKVLRRQQESYSTRIHTHPLTNPVGTINYP